MIPRQEEIKLMNEAVEAAKRINTHDHNSLVVLRSKLEKLRLYRVRKARKD